MKKRLFIILLIIVLLVVLYALRRNTTTQQATNGTFKIGVIAPLTGPLAEYGEAFKNGITLAQSESTNKKVEFIFEDSAYDSNKTISAYYKLRDSDKVNMVYNWGDPTSQALAPVVKDSSMPFVAFTSVAPVTQTSPYTVRPWNRPEDFARAMWSYLREKNLHRIAVVKVNNLYLNSLYEALAAQRHDGESVTLIDNYLSFDDKDFRTSIVKIKNAGNYDALGVYLASGQIGQFYKQANQQSLKLATFGTDFFENQSDIDAAGSAIDGAVYANYSVSDQFRDTYKARFGSVSQISYAGNGYDVTKMVLGQFDLSSASAIAASFKKVANYPGVLGNYNYMEGPTDRFLASPVHIKEIRGGSIQTIR